MFKVPLAKSIKIIQDIQLRKPQDDHHFRKKRRITSSMSVLEEELVISDSDEERNFTETLFGPAPDLPNRLAEMHCDILTGQKENKYCDAEVQCELLTAQKTVFGLIDQCAKLNADDVGDLKGIIKSCEKFIARHSFNRNDMDELSEISIITKNDERCCSPSRTKKKETKKTKPNNKLKSGLVSSNESSSNESRSKSAKRKGSKRIQHKSEGNGPFSSTQIFNDMNSTFKKPLEVDINMIAEKIPKEVVKSLARNWMKPHKSFCIVEDDLESRPHFASLQSRKVRRLYSPSQWLISQQFLNSCSTNQN